VQTPDTSYHHSTAANYKAGANTRAVATYGGKLMLHTPFTQAVHDGKGAAYKTGYGIMPCSVMHTPCTMR
jgi:hypothetical protein